MRNLFIVSMLLGSLSSLADTTLLFSVFAEGTGEPIYEITATFTGNEDQLKAVLMGQENRMENKVSIKMPDTQDLCEGKYVIDFSNAEKQLVVKFDGLNGPGTSGGCANNSLDVDINRAQLAQVLSGKTEIVTFRGIQSLEANRQASVRKID